MDLKNEDLQVFLDVYQAGTFSAAAKTTGLTQSALSQKMARLEESLSASVFIRHPRNLELTSTGEKLLIYAKESLQRQKDFLSQLDQFQEKIAGNIRLAGFSSIMRSLVIPKLAPLLEEHTNLDIELSSHEMFELENYLKTNRSDYIITDYFPNLIGCESIQIGHEEYVIIESKNHKFIPKKFLDHGSFDNATENYFDFQQMKKDYSRLYMGDVYSIIDGVSLGLGRAVMSKHLIEKDKRFKIKKAKKRYIRPLVLSWRKLNYYSELHHLFLNSLSKLN